MAQTSEPVRGSVLDPSGAVINGAAVQIQNPVSRYNQSTQTDGQGNLEFNNVPFNPYHVSSCQVSLRISASSETVTVVGAGDLVEADAKTHTDVDRELFDKLPLESNSSSLSSLLTLATPGVAADSNGLFHGLGDHASNSFSIDAEGFDFSYGQQKWGNFISANGLNMGRFLDGPEYQIFHDHGNEENAFDRFDYQPGSRDQISTNFQFTRSWFQTPHS